MCLAVPLKIRSIDGKQAVGEAAGLSQTLRVDFLPDLKPVSYTHLDVYKRQCMLSISRDPRMFSIEPTA